MKCQCCVLNPCQESHSTHEGHRAAYVNTGGKKHRFHKLQKSRDDSEDQPDDELPRNPGRFSLGRRGRLPSISIDLDDGDQCKSNPPGIQPPAQTHYGRTFVCFLA
ncbi:uncharacterized protein LOC113468339 [Diaphorina citri]|uniref:Uncharacterized protein LOC113468339 n=1 Tax=Diaphorina citri TaxID=121845 RepID=A0A3Q0J2L7_DIACI|nr:uncharacterized protein LOC113468339 [Diaphorina citri]